MVNPGFETLEGMLNYKDYDWRFLLRVDHHWKESGVRLNREHVRRALRVPDLARWQDYFPNLNSLKIVLCVPNDGPADPVACFGDSAAQPGFLSVFAERIEKARIDVRAKGVEVEVTGIASIIGFVVIWPCIIGVSGEVGVCAMMLVGGLLGQQ